MVENGNMFFQSTFIEDLFIYFPSHHEIMNDGHTKSVLNDAMMQLVYRGNFNFKYKIGVSMCCRDESIYLSLQSHTINLQKQKINKFWEN